MGERAQVKLTRFNDWVLRHWGGALEEELAQRLYEGELSGMLGLNDVGGEDVRLCCCVLCPRMGFWRVNRWELLADVKATLELAWREEGSEERGAFELYITLAVCLDDEVRWSVEAVSARRPDRSGTRLDDALIPIMGREDVDGAAEAIWRAWLPEALGDWRRVSGRALAGRMGLEIALLPLSGTARSVLFWRDSAAEVALEDGGTAMAPVAADTLVINTRAVPEAAYELYVLHECFHWEYHWLFYRLQALPSDDLRALNPCGEPGGAGKLPLDEDEEPWDGWPRGDEAAEGWNPLPILEWEARQGSRALLMPAPLFLPMVRRRAQREAARDGHMGRVMERVGRETARRLGLPLYLVRARMLSLGFWQARGALNFPEGVAVEAFAFDRESWPSGRHTFVIGALEALRLYARSADFRARLDSGRYVYVRGHVCLNDERFVVPTSRGPRLTEWANRHVDLCCLRFENVYETDAGFEFRLERVNSDEEYNRHYIDFIEGADRLSAGEVSRRQAEVIESLPRLPGEALRELMRLRGVSRERLAELAMVSDSTVKRWRREAYSFTPETAVRIVVALSLPPWLSGWLLETARVPLQYHGAHMVYRNIICCHFMDTMGQVNDLIEQAGYRRLRETE